MANRYWVGGTANWNGTAGTKWATTSGGAGGAAVPTASDDVFFDANSGFYAISVNSGAVCNSLDFTGFTGEFKSYLGGTPDISGSLTLVSGMIMSSSMPFTFVGTGNLTAATRTLGTITLDSTAVVTLQDTLTVATFLISGDLITNNQTITCTSLFRVTSAGSCDFGSSQVTISDVFDTYSGSTITAGTSIITLTANGAVFDGNGKTYYHVKLAGTSHTITGSNTFTTFESTSAVAQTLLFTAGTTQTITNFTVSGTSGNVITLNSTTTGVFYLVSAGGSQDCDYLNIQHCVATPSTLTWHAGENSTDNQATAAAGSGWLFGAFTFANPGNIYASDNAYATLAAISGVLTVDVSKNAGADWQVPRTVTFTGSDTTQTCGTGSTELWGASWTRADMIDANFRVRLSHNGISQIFKTFGFATGTDPLTGIEIAIEGKYATSTLSLDHLKVKIYYGTSPLTIQAGSQAFATNGRKNGEGAGAGTGVLVFHDGTAWKAVDTGATVAA